MSLLEKLIVFECIFAIPYNTLNSLITHIALVFMCLNEITYDTG